LTDPIHRVLREGGDEVEFNRNLERLQDLNPRRLEITIEICERLEFGELLKYNSRFTHFTAVGGQLNREYQVDRLITYLALTSLDIISREEYQCREFRDFPDWLFASLEDPITKPSIVSMIDALENKNAVSIIDILRTTIPNLKTAYYYEEGVSRLFKRILREGVDHWMREWLCSIYFIAKNAPFRDTISPQTLPWNQLGVEDRYVLLADYLFSLRNLYTHTSSYINTQELNRFRSTERDAPSFAIRYSDVPDAITQRVKWFVALRSDLAESEVIRMISVHILRKWLGYHDNLGYIETYLRRLTFRYNTYSLDNELIYNSHVIGKWATIESQVILLSRSDLNNFRLTTTFANQMLALSDPSNRYRPFILEELPQYLDLLTRVNNNVQLAFDEAISFGDDLHRGDNIIRTGLQQLASSLDARNLLYSITKLRQTIDQVISVPFY